MRHDECITISSLHGSSHSYERTSASNSGSNRRSPEVLHPPHDCPHCHAYKVHVVYSSLHDDALERAWTGTSSRYEEGGRSSPEYDITTRELYETRTTLRRVRRHRDEAVALNARYRSEVALLERQLREAKDRLLAIEIAYETQLWTDFPIEASQPDAGLPREQEDDFEEGIFRSNGSQDAGIEMDELWTMENPIVQAPTFPNAGWNDLSDDFDLVQQLDLIIQNETCSEDDSSNDVIQKLPQSTKKSTQPVYFTDSSSNSPASSTSSSLLSESEIDSVVSVSDESASPPATSRSSEEDFRHTLKLMASAHEEGNTTALAEVKKLIMQAERTPRHSRTKGQKYVLLNWRSPSSSSRNSHSVSTSPQPQSALPVHPLPPSSKGTEIFVDASPLGIGFVFNTQWLAWTFKKTPKIPLGKDKRIVMSWAELLAVEVGLRALITAGYSSTTITLRSDNTGVIEALEKKSWCQRHGIEEILQNILTLCREHRIKLKPTWISTKENPADMPSRGLFPPWSLIYNFPPTLPARLSDLLEIAAP